MAKKSEFIILKDRDGNPVAHENITGINVLMADGTEQVFSASDGNTADYTISYMSIDGTEELYVKGIMHGDTAGDVIELGLMDEPIIPNTEEKEYTFLGWSDSIGGEVKTTMFESVTENRVVYAVYHVITTIATGECGESASWKLTDDGLLRIYGAGAMDDYATAADQPWHEYANTITSVVVEDGITYTGTRAFQNTAMESLNLPDSLVEIGRNLAYGCVNLTAVVIPDSVTSLGNNALFYGCTSLTSVTIPDSVTSIGAYAFYQCSALKSANIGNGVTYIGEYAFHSCTTLASVTMSNSIKTIYYRAFQNCSALTSIRIPASCNLIGDNAFYGCYALTAVAFGQVSGWAYATTQTATNWTLFLGGKLSNSSTAASYLTSSYVSKWWKNTEVA